MTDEEQELLEQYLIYERQVQKPTSQWSPASTTSSAWTAPCPQLEDDDSVTSRWTCSGVCGTGSSGD